MFEGGWSWVRGMCGGLVACVGSGADGRLPRAPLDAARARL